MRWKRLLNFSPLAVSLGTVLLSMIFENNFNFYNNALSDLGHPLLSRSAPVFNLGLVLSGLLGYTVSITAKTVVKKYRVLLTHISVDHTSRRL